MKVILHTQRLLLIPFDMHDLALLHQTFTEPSVRKYLWDDEIISKAQVKEILERNAKYFETQAWGLWKVMMKEKNEYAGFAGLWMFFDEHQPQLLYGLLPEFSGKGYATEASQAVIEYAFEKLNFKYLSASYDTPHKASGKVCERLGMQWVEEKIVEGKSITFYRIKK
ncbi:MAG TPA: GNAT family N-acetyltransferase [Cyclobacteriaceae bacterium]|nr:GNAT family N-acetyltransferase [Cyclobacteriaceae bacterium]